MARKRREYTAAERKELWQNPFVEGFNGRTRNEVLDVELFHTLAEAQVILPDWRTAYNTEHPHSALGMLPPARFAAIWDEEASPTPHSARPPGSLREVSAVDATVPVDTDQELSVGVDR